MHVAGAVGTRTAGQALVGRADELAMISAELGAARGGTARVVLLTGEPGIGKTALARTAVGQADGVRVLRSVGEASERDMVYGAVDQLLDGVSDRPAASLGATPLAVGAALLQLISDLETQGPVLIWIDDLQWADPPSQRALLFLLRRLEADPVLVLLCQRDDTDALLAPGLVRHLDGEGCRRLALRGLSEHDLVELADAAIEHLPRSAVRRLHQHTGGNPLWVLALLRETPTARLLDADGRLPAPRTFAATIAKRLATLGPEARGLVEASAVAGGESTLGLLVQVAPAGASFAALDEATAAHLLVSSDETPPVVRPAHALIGSAVYDGLDPSRRAALHAAFAREAPTEHERLRHEIAASPGHDAALSARVAQTAVTAAAGGAWSVASDMFRRAARLSPTMETRRERLEHAMAAALMGSETERAAALADEIGTVPASPRRNSLLGWLALEQARYDEAEPLLVEAIRAGEAAALLPVVAEASRMLTHLLVILGRSHEAVPHAQRAIDINPPDSIESGVARAHLVIAHVTCGDFAAAERLTVHLDEANVRPHELVTLVGRGNGRVLSGDYPGAVRDLSAVIAVSRAAGAFEYLCVAWSQMSRAQYHLGHWDAAIESAEQAVEIAEDARQVWATSAVHSNASFISSRRGDWATAADHVRTALEASAMTRDAMSIAYAHTAAALLAHSRGTFDEVLSATSGILALTHRTGVDQPGTLEWQPAHAEALVRTGRLGEAGEFIDAFLANADHVGHTWAKASAHRVNGLLLARTECLSEALAAFAAAGELAVAARTPFEAALVDLQHGQTLRRLGRRKDAVVVLTRGLATFTRLGAAPFVGLAVRELSAAGIDGQVSPKAPAKQLLTRQELTISRLVGKGLSNRDIAAELFISTKTVEFHLVNAYRKLGVSSRTQLVRRLARG